MFMLLLCHLVHTMNVECTEWLLTLGLSHAM